MNSLLNPEAPEFYPHLTSVTQDGYSSMNKTIRTSNKLPTGDSHNMFKTYTNFNIVKGQLSVNVVAQSNKIVTSELPSVKLKYDDIQDNTDKIIDVNDSTLDRVNINLDTKSGVNAPSDNFIKSMGKVSSWNNKPVIAKIQMGSTTFIGAKNIPRPQLTFKDTIDNSESLWVPKISDKPNNIKPLALNILYNEDGEVVGYEHPYKVELDLYHPPSEFIDPDPDTNSFPPSLEETNLTYIDTESQIDELVKHLDTVKELAVDVEHHSYRTYQGITCLIQITTNEGGDFLIDALALREHIHKLNLVFTNPKKLKVFHGAESDVIWLQRDFGVYLVGLFDTHQAARALQFSGLALKNLLLHYCNVNTDKKYQLADWRIRPLPEELIHYARLDTHYLLYIWRQMKQELLEASAGHPKLLLSVFENSRHICNNTYNKTVLHEDSHVPLYLSSKKNFNSQQMAALKMIYKWRDAQARLHDESTTYLLPNHMLLLLAETLPREMQGVNACCHPMPPFVKQHLNTIHKMVLSCRQLPVEPQLYHMPASIRNMVNTMHHPILYNVHDLTYFPDMSEDLPMSVDGAALLAADYTGLCKPTIQAFEEITEEAFEEIPDKKVGIVSGLNVDAKLFIPPYDRYKKYRTLAQVEEIKEYKIKEAKITAILKENEQMKTEVLAQLQQAKAKIEQETNNDAAEVPETIVIEDDVQETKSQRKRKMSADKTERKGQAGRVDLKKESEENKKAEGKNNQAPNVNYKNVNYRKFYTDNDTRKVNPKIKFRTEK